MDWETVLAEVLSILVKFIAVVVISYIAKLLKEKFHNDKVNKYVDKAADVVIQCVDFVNQTYVDALKKDGKFDKKAQREAFDMSKFYIKNLLEAKAKEAVIEMFGDFDIWVDSMIETSVRNSVDHMTAIPIDEGVVIEDA